MAQPRIKGIIFDFNGVIVDDYLLQKEAWSRISETLRDRPVTDEEMVHKIRGAPTKDTIKWMSDNKLSQKQVEEIAQLKNTITKETFNIIPLLQLTPGLSAFLDELSNQKILRTITTSQTPEAFDHLFEKLRLEKWLAETSLSATTERIRANQHQMHILWERAC